MEPTLDFKSNRSPIYSTKGIVAASQPLAVAAGLAMLQQGGNAADAAIAAAAVLNVTEPMSTGMGGDAFCLFFEAKTKKVHALNGSGRSPARLSLERLQREGFIRETPARHAYNVTVPGACAAWCDLVERFGALRMDKILAPAIGLAEGGFPVGPLTAPLWQKAAEEVLSKSYNGQALTINGRGPKPGELFKNPDLGKTMCEIAEGGKDAFYQGRIAEIIASAVQKAGGCLEVDDIAAHISTWDEPISTTYHGVRIWECPPNGQGLTALIALNILEDYPLSDMPSLSPERKHIEIEAMRLAFADAGAYIADPTFAGNFYLQLLDKVYAAERRKLILKDKANPHITAGKLTSQSDTVYLSVVDEQGNACSFINSIYMLFGSGIVPKGLGFCLQNRGNNFSLQPGHPNCVEPNKRPYHTIIPAMATRDSDNSLYASYGVMGGFMQPQGHVQVTLAMLNDGLDPQAALDRPRFCLDPKSKDGLVSLETGIPEETIRKLQEMGHLVQVVSGLDRSLFGRGQIIRYDPASKVFWAGSDPRADGCAMTYV